MNTTTVSPVGKLLLLLSGLLGLAFFALGIVWLSAPIAAAEALGATLLEGTGLSTQIGDSAAFFLCSGFFMMFGAMTRSSAYLRAGALLIGVVAPARLHAWHFHGADLSLDKIIPEIIVFILVMSAAASVRRA